MPRLSNKEVRKSLGGFNPPPNLLKSTPLFFIAQIDLSKISDLFSLSGETKQSCLLGPFLISSGAGGGVVMNIPGP